MNNATGWNIDWDTSIERVSLFLNGSSLPTLQNVAAMEPGHNFTGDLATTLTLFPWTGTADTTQLDNIRITKN